MPILWFAYTALLVLLFVHWIRQFRRDW